jgi:predicted acylesterase/phospholipase RssA
MNVRSKKFPVDQSSDAVLDAPEWQPRDIIKSFMLQGGGTFGGLPQAGVYEALHEEKIEVDWLSGV